MIRELRTGELTVALFSAFQRHQRVTKCWRKIDGSWTVIDNPFVEDWGEPEYQCLVKCLRNTLDTGGVVYGAFQNGTLKGFASVEASLFGSEKQYLELSCIHVSADCRGHGIGRSLMEAAKGWAQRHGGKKLYISAHSSVESQAFYHAMGCREAEEYSRIHVEKEPCDCQLELNV
ncbi:MAG: GNAT family N-acetyltransferase [Candidatus Onthomonas sp.]